MTRSSPGARLGITWLATLVCIASLSANGGVARLTMATHREAVACGKAGEACAVTPYDLCVSPSAAFAIRLATPFSRVASAVFEAPRIRSGVGLMSPGEANGWGVGVYVMPGGNPRTADSIQQVVIKRGDDTVEPVTVTLAPSTTGARRGGEHLGKGFFAFPFEAFAPTSTVTLVLSGSATSETCSLDPSALARLR